MYWYVLPTLSWVCVVTMPELRAGALMSKLYFLFCWPRCTMPRSSTGYGTRRARGGRYVHLQHRARTATDYTDSAGRDMQRLYFLCYLMLNVLTCYIKWWWPDAAAAASSGRVSKYHFTEQENCWKQFLLKLFEVHYDYTSI